MNILLLREFSERKSFLHLTVLFLLKIAVIVCTAELVEFKISLCGESIINLGKLGNLSMSPPITAAHSI